MRAGEFKPIEIARRTGVSIRALRLYEQHGLLTPRRDAKGWRVYDAEVIARLHQVLSLKRLGLTLSQIGDLLAREGLDLAAALEVQEAVLQAQQGQLDAALASIRTARTRLADGDALAVDVLIELTRQVAQPNQGHWREAFAPLMRRHLRPEQIDDLTARNAFTADEANGRLWEGLVADARALIGSDPSAPAALDLARRWRSAQGRFTGGDPALTAGLRAVWRQAISDPDLAPNVPIDAEIFDFVLAAGLMLKAREG